MYSAHAWHVDRQSNASMLARFASKLARETIAGKLEAAFRRRLGRMLSSQGIQPRCGACWLHTPAVPSTRRHLRTNAIATAEYAVDSATSLQSTPDLCRRSFIGSAAALSAALCLSPEAQAAAKGGADDLVEFVPGTSLSHIVARGLMA